MSTEIDWMWPVRERNFWRCGWGVYSVACGECGQHTVFVARNGTISRGVPCPSCGAKYDFVFHGNHEDERFPYHDGVWL